MKKITLVILSVFLFSFQNEKSTKGIFEYEQIETRNKGKKSHIMFFNLNINDKYSTYTQTYKEEMDEKYTEENEEGVSNIIVIKPKKNEMKIVYNDFINSEMYFKDIVAYDRVYVKEMKMKMEWTLSEETRRYGTKICKKATTFFRGRKYTAWYFPDIKTKVGPWKFVNTPGLIFEIYDNENILHIKLNKLNTKKYSNINSWENEKNEKVISMTKYISLTKKAEDVILERLNSKLPKGSKPFIKNKEQKEIEIL
ncbi:MAG: GLPGLI family protein [Flavobacterium sp.]